jgi:hypothetical protein
VSADDAHAAIENRTASGKVVIDVADGSTI